MLALAAPPWLPTEFYTRLEHPVQQRCLAEVSRWTEVPAADIRTAVDGSDRVLRDAAEEHGVGVRETGECGFRIADCGFERRASSPQSAIRIVESMLRHPELIAGEGRAVYRDDARAPRRVIAKVGAKASIAPCFSGTARGSRSR